jgi:hypothetical protein
MSQQVVGGAGEVCVHLNASGTDEARLAKPAVGLQPPEDLLDPFALALTDPVALVSRGAIVQPGSTPAVDPGDVRTDAASAQLLDEVPSVIALVTAQALGTNASISVPSTVK